MSETMLCMDPDPDKYVLMKKQFLIASENITEYCSLLTKEDINYFDEDEILCFNYHDGVIAFSTNTMQNGFFNVYCLWEEIETPEEVVGFVNALIEEHLEFLDNLIKMSIEFLIRTGTKLFISS